MLVEEQKICVPESRSSVEHGSVREFISDSDWGPGNGKG